MNADAVAQPFLDFRPIRAGEFEAFQRAGNGILLFARAHVDAGEILRALGGFELGEVDDIHRRAPGGKEAFQSFGERQFRILMC